MTPAAIDSVFGRSRLRMVTGDHVEVFREASLPGERRRYTKRFLATAVGDFRPWTEREWRILARLVGHGIDAVPEVVRFDRGSFDLPALVQTYDAGVTVDHWATLLPVARDGAALQHVFADCAHWWALARQCLIALDAIHALQLVHLDLKADNVCIPLGPPDFDPHAPGREFKPCFEQLTLIDFAFSLVSGESLASALPIAGQSAGHSAAPAGSGYQSPRLLHALRCGADGDLQPTRALDWRCDFFSLAVMLGHYLPDPNPDAAPGPGWSAALSARANALLRQLLEIHAAPCPAQRPHAALIELATAALREPALTASLQRGWTLGVAGSAGSDDSPTPVTRIALPPGQLAANAAFCVDDSDRFFAAHTPVKPVRRAIAGAMAGRPQRRVGASAVAGLAAAALAVPLLGEGWIALREGGEVAAAGGPGAVVALPGSHLAAPRAQALPAAVLARLANDPAPVPARQGGSVDPPGPAMAAVAASAAAAPAPAPAPAPASSAVLADAALAPASSTAPADAARPVSDAAAAASGPAASAAARRDSKAAAVPPLATVAATRKAAAGGAAAARPDGRGRRGAAPAALGTTTALNPPARAGAAPGRASARPVAVALASVAAARPSRVGAAATTHANAAPVRVGRASGVPAGSPPLAATPGVAAPPVRSAKMPGELPPGAVVAALPPAPTSSEVPAPWRAAAPAGGLPGDAPAPPAARRVNAAAQPAAPAVPRDFDADAQGLLAEQLPRIAQRAERLVLRVLHAAGHADPLTRDDAVRVAAGSIRLAPQDVRLLADPASDAARSLNEAARDALRRRGDLPQALALQTRALGANPLDVEVVGNLAALRLRQQPAQADAARQLALHALTLNDARYPHGRIEDWTTLAIASALAGREREARHAWFVSVALAPDLERQCRAAINAYATHGERLREPVEAMLQRVHLSGRPQRSPLCAWPPHWSVWVSR